MDQAYPKNSKITDLQKKINDLELKKNSIKSQQLNFSKSERKKRTRTLIQAGAILNMMGFFDICDIAEGDDLELDIESKDKAAVLIGMLETLKNTLPHSLDNQDLQKFKNIGIRVLKMRGRRYFFLLLFNVKYVIYLI
ncbi:MAG: conjugal transfer protein TraD [Proteobacteria bacterium]|nr:conjugal transfer protein TraD [Pseudomonadota bacterium]